MPVLSNVSSSHRAYSDVGHGNHECLALHHDASRRTSSDLEGVARLRALSHDISAANTERNNANHPDHERGGDKDQEIALLRKDNVTAYVQLQRHRRWLTYATIFSVFVFVFGIVCLAWSLKKNRADNEELRRSLVHDAIHTSCDIIKTDDCTNKPSGHHVFKTHPMSMAADAAAAAAPPLLLTPLLRTGRVRSAVKSARVSNVLQSENSFSGFLSVRNESRHLFFWCFTARTSMSRQQPPPLLLWIQGPTGWPATYAIFKANGPYLAGWNDEEKRPYLVSNPFTWIHTHHVLYVDSPVNTGFSFGSSMAKSEREVAEDLVELLNQFALMLPFMAKDQVAETTRLFLVGESWGGRVALGVAKRALVLSQEHKLDASTSTLAFRLDGVMSISSWINASHQLSHYSTSMSEKVFLGLHMRNRLQLQDVNTRHLLREERHDEALHSFLTSLDLVSKEIMGGLNVFDMNFDDNNYLNNHNYLCFLNQPHVRQGIHVGNGVFRDGVEAFEALNTSLTTDLQTDLEDVLEAGIEVLLVQGQNDVILDIGNTAGMLSELKRWNGAKRFASKPIRATMHVWNEEKERQEEAGYLAEANNLAFLVIRKAGHLVSVAQPRWMLHTITHFTHRTSLSRGGNRFSRPSASSTSSNSDKTC